MYCLLQFLNSKNIEDIQQLSTEMVIEYIKVTKINRQREMLCELRGIFRYLERTDLYNAIAGIHAPRIKRIIPVLTESELDKIYAAINEGKVTLRDAACHSVVSRVFKIAGISKLGRIAGMYNGDTCIITCLKQ